MGSLGAMVKGSSERYRQGGAESAGTGKLVLFMLVVLVLVALDLVGNYQMFLLV